tara:strand:+ start:412 stop:1557 length:1146 start_codon:yes stop_codon:yes gene_type:complete
MFKNKILIICKSDIRVKDGYYFKLKGQYKALKKNKFIVSLIVFYGQYILYISQNKILKKFKLIKFIPSSIQFTFFNFFYSFKSDAKFIYLRHLYSNPLEIFFMMILKFSKVIFAEFPTYPYRRIISKHNEFKYKIAFLVDSFCLPFVKYAYTYALNIGSKRNILGIKTLFISNGIDFNFYKRKKNNFNTNENRLNFLFIGNLVNYHGLDRLIYGIRNFLDQNGDLLDLNLDIVSTNTDEYKRLKYLVNSLKLNNYINFIPQVFNKQLNFYYDKADIGLSALAWHRVNITCPSNIKSREYCVMGLPFLYSGNDPLINNRFKYAFQVPEDNGPIDIMKILKFKNLIYENKQFPEKMKSFAAKSLNWEYAMNNFLKLLLIENQN